MADKDNMEIEQIDERMQMETEEKQFELLDFPDEVLENIFAFFDDRTLLNATQVSQRFKNIANETVQNKYNGTEEERFYEINACKNSSGNDLQHDELQHRPFFEAFSNRISAVQITFYEGDICGDHWSIVMIKNHSRHLTKLIFYGYIHGKVIIDLEQIIVDLPNLNSLKLGFVDIKNNRWMNRNYPMLIDIYVSYIDESWIQDLRSFFEHNPQLENFECAQLNDITVNVFNGTNLKRLCGDGGIWCDTFKETEIEFIPEHSEILMPKLIEIAIGNESKALFDVIGTGCKNIERFTLFRVIDYDITDHQLNMMCSLSKLTEITMEGVSFTIAQVKKLIKKFPALKKLLVGCSENPSTVDLKPVIEISGNDLKSLELQFNLNTDLCDFQRISSEFHTWYSNVSKEDQMLILTNYVRRYSMVTVTKNYVKDGYGYHTLIHYIGCRGSADSNAANILSLNDKCLNKIIKELDNCGHLVLYQTCKRLRRLVTSLVKDELSHNTFYIEPTMKDYLRFFGKCMSRISSYTKDQESDTGFLALIHKYCGNNLEELTWMTNDFRIFIENGLQFPKLKKLVLTGDHLQLFDESTFNYHFCPNLNHLEFKCPEITMAETVNFGNIFDNLTIIRFDRYNPDALTFLKCLNDKVCSNLRELSLVKLDDAFETDTRKKNYPFNNEVVNTISRFINLTTLHLIIRENDSTNTKYLFESLANLETVTVLKNGSCFSSCQLDHIRRSCIKLQKLQLIVDSKVINSHYELKCIHHDFPKIKIKIIELGTKSALNDRYHYLGHGFYLTKDWLDRREEMCDIFA